MNSGVARKISRGGKTFQGGQKFRNLRFSVEKSFFMNSMKLAIPLHSWYWSIHTKDESKRGTAFAFIFGVN